MQEIQNVLFATADRNLERWRESVLDSAGGKSVWLAQKGIKQTDMVVCELFRDRKKSTQSKPLKPNVMAIYLPRAFSVVLPRLVDLKKQQAYGFAAYNSAANDFDMRTVTVVGPEEITMADRKIQAIRLTDRPAADAEPANLWVDAEGTLLRMTTADGLSVEKAAKKLIIRRFPNDQLKIRVMNF